MIAGVDQQAQATDAELLAGLRGRRLQWAYGLLALLCLVLGVGALILGRPGLTVGPVLGALGWGWSWWADPEPRLQEVTDEALLVRHGLRTRSIARSDIEDVAARYGYGLVLTLRDADPVELAGTAPRFSVADAQAAALRRWAGLPS